MKLKTTYYRKPNLLVLLTFFVGLGVLATSLVQAAEPLNILSTGKQAVEPRGAAQWQRSVAGLELLETLRTWKAELTLDDAGRGLQLARPFGGRGPILRLSNTIPDEVKRCLRAGGDHQIGNLGADNPDAYVYLEKRW